MFINSSDPAFALNVDGYETGRHLENARRQAEQRHLDEVLIIDVDSHHYETDNFRQILELIEDKPLRTTALNTYQYKGPGAVLYEQPGFQDIGGRGPRHQNPKAEAVPDGGRARGVVRALGLGVGRVGALGTPLSPAGAC